jgi:DegV family protein with EDD domain
VVHSNPAIKYMMPIIKQYGRIQEILDASLMTDLQTYKHLQYMVKLGILVVEVRTRSEIKLITDSSSDLPPNIVNDLNITVLPISVIFSDQLYIDGVDMNADSFYQMLNSVNAAPAVSAPSVEEFHEMFLKTLPSQDVIAVFPSGKISRTLNNAHMAKKKNAEEYLSERKKIDSKTIQFEIINSETVSMGAGLLVMEIAELIGKGLSVNNILDEIHKTVSRIRLFLIIDNVEYMERIGKGGKTTKSFSNLLGLKPIVSNVNGELKDILHVRGEKQAMKQVVELIRRSMIEKNDMIKACILHADAPNKAAAMKSIIESNLKCEDVFTTPIGPLLGSYCGPGAVGVACIIKSERD